MVLPGVGGCCSPVAAPGGWRRVLAVCRWWRRSAVGGGGTSAGGVPAWAGLPNVCGLRCFQCFLSVIFLHCVLL